MRKIKFVVHLFLSLGVISPAVIFSTAVNGSTMQNEVVDRLRAGGHLLMIRHALAPGSGDPVGFRIEDCLTQRNINDTGRAQAIKIGKWLRDSGIDSVRLYSSQWCRCLETARLMDLGAVQELAALNSFYDRIQDREPNLTALNDFISRQPAKGELIIFVTHFVTISAMTGKNVSSGEGVLLEINEDASYTVIGQISFGE